MPPAGTLNRRPADRPPLPTSADCRAHTQCHQMRHQIVEQRPSLAEGISFWPPAASRCRTGRCRGRPAAVLNWMFRVCGVRSNGLVNEDHTSSSPEQPAALLAPPSTSSTNHPASHPLSTTLNTTHLLPQPPRVDVLLHQRAGAVLGVPDAVVEDLHDGEAGVQAWGGVSVVVGWVVGWRGGLRYRVGVQWSVASRRPPRHWSGLQSVARGGPSSASSTRAHR
jgi:hypothetical protein